MASFISNFPPLVYNKGEFYYSDGLKSYSFWRTDFTYTIDWIVTYDNKNWISTTDSNTTIPNENSGIISDTEFYYTWKETNLPTRWKSVDLWKSDTDYGALSSWNQTLFTFGNYVVYNDVVYGATSTTRIGITPDLDPTWKRIYSMVPDTNILYGPSFSENNIVEMNGKYYQCVSNKNYGIVSTDTFYNYSLDNGIYVIINEKHKNVLVNIYVNDNTYSDVVKRNSVWDIEKDNIKNTNRDDIYTTIFSKLSTNNLMNSLNDLSNKFGFSDLVKYIIVGEDSSIKIYDFNDLKSVGNLPYLLTCEPADELLVRARSNIYQSLTLKPSEIKAKRRLNDSNIDNFSKLDYYNEMHLASSITKNLQTPVLIPNYSGLKNKIFYRLYRFSGFYSPILKNIELFESPGITQSNTNYKFDTDLTDFGIIKQRIVSKVNRKNNILRLRNEPNLKSIYPMIDEYGYHIIDFFMFKSTWDLEYHYECQEYEPVVQLTQLDTKTVNIKTSEFKNNNTKLL